jgi:hypothetical protein
MFSDLVAVGRHVQVSAFLFYGLRRGMMSGLSTQTVVAVTMSACLLVIKKFWWKVNEMLQHHQPKVTTEWECETGGFCVSAILLLMSLHMLHKKKANAKEDRDETEDDFGRKEVRYLWFKLFPQTRAPPAYLHWCLIYVGALALTCVTAWVSSSFSLAALAAWALRRPTAMMAIFDNYIRGLLVLPQLHVSQKTGVISPAVAIWIALIGVVDVTELATDGIVFSVANMCYIVGDLISLLLVSDFMWVFFKALWRGKKFVEIQMCEV